MWPKCRKLISLKKGAKFLGGVGIILLIYFYFSQDGQYIEIPKSSSDSLQNDDDSCDRPFVDNSPAIHSRLQSGSSLKTRQHILLFLADQYSRDGKAIRYMLEAARMKYHPQYGTVKSLPSLIDDEKGRFMVIIFETAEIYLKLSKWNREILDKYCVKYDVGVILFIPPSKKKPQEYVEIQRFGNFPLSYTANLDMKDAVINPESKVLRITRPGKQVDGSVGTGWSVFKSNHSTYEAVVSGFLSDPTTAGRSKFFAGQLTDLNSESNPSESRKVFKKAKTDYPIMIVDNGKHDKIRRVIYGNNLEFWLFKILFMDTVSFLSKGKLSQPLNRYIQVDIDDIFVSVEGTRMTKDDVMKLVEFQSDMQSKVPGFNFLIGYSGKFVSHGNEAENQGDRTFLEQSHRFQWFPHMWSHMQAHLFGNSSYLCDYMEPNRKFAVRHKLNVSSRYAVAPHHAGVYPVHEPLYDCWKMVWDVDVTSTEEYPNLRPDQNRRGFIYRGIKVLPRQTCGLFTHTNYLEKYPGGPDKLDSLINGGQLFLTVLLNKYNIYMTHFSNYGNDRLALYVFEKLIKFVQCWTNLRLSQIPPADMARKYFEEYPQEETPIWTDPCADSRHLEIWSKDKSCERLPKFVIVGPQKTGTTALHWFLQMHPDLKPSRPSPQTFEEIQFFNTPNYLKGLDWYMDFFPFPETGGDTLLYEKSANYFSSPVAPHRLHALLPHSRVVILLIDPAKRAYSWYQHMVSHDDPTALNFSFHDIVKAGIRSSPAVLALQARCLLPGRYAEHIEKWLEYFSPSQVIIEDGELLAKNPIPVLERLQISLGVKNILNYSQHVQYNSKKGFYCKIGNSRKLDCLGKGKGREYPVMSERSRVYLKAYYKESNEKLANILKRMKRRFPDWLQESIDA